MEHTQLQPEELSIDKTIFRAYDIRGIYEENLTADVVYKIGAALGTLAKQKNIKEFITARDGRLSSPILALALQQGLLSTGCNVIDIGAVPTPILYFATKTLTTNTGVMLTGSHNPGKYNGLKIVFAGKTLSADDIQHIYHLVVANEFATGRGDLTNLDIVKSYMERIESEIKLTRPLKVVVDCGNGIAGIIAPSLLRRLGCDVIELFCNVDGNFPNHDPDPSTPENLHQLMDAVLHHQADIGLAFDGDADRLGVVTNHGELIMPDRQMMLYAKDVLQKNPGASVIFDVKCTRNLAQVIQVLGGKPIMWKTGHSLIKTKMAEMDAKLAGEMSGHIFFNDSWYGFDDGMYTAARLLKIITQEMRDVSSIFQEFPNSINTPELKIKISDEAKFNFMDQLINNADFTDAQLATIDGIRVDFSDGWGLVRASNTTPAIVVRFEAENEASLERIQASFRHEIHKIDASLELPF